MAGDRVEIGSRKFNNLSYREQLIIINRRKRELEERIRELGEMIRETIEKMSSELHEMVSQMISN